MKNKVWGWISAAGEIRSQTKRFFDGIAQVYGIDQ
jgi:hypothetical protein